MLAQLDMPAMVFTLLALLLFVRRQYGWAAVASVALVLVKETGIVTPLVFCSVLALEKDWKRASWFRVCTPIRAALGWISAGFRCLCRQGWRSGRAEVGLLGARE